LNTSESYIQLAEVEFLMLLIMQLNCRKWTVHVERSESHL